LFLHTSSSYIVLAGLHKLGVNHHNFHNLIRHVWLIAGIGEGSPDHEHL